MMIISPLIHARQSATVTVSDCCRISCAPSGAPVHGFNACASDYATVFTPVIHTAQAFAVLACFSRLVYATVNDGDINSFWRYLLSLSSHPVHSLAPCARRLYTRLLAAMTMQARPSNANLEIISPVHNAAKKLSPQYTHIATAVTLPV